MTRSTVRFQFLLLAGLLLAAPHAHAYDGLIAPAGPEDTLEKTPGVIAPLSPVSPDTPAAQTSKPGVSGTPTGNLRVLSSIHGADRNRNGIPDKMEMPSANYSKAKISLVDGKTATEAAAEKQIAYQIKMIEEATQGSAIRQDRISKALASLGQLQQGLTTRKGVSDSIYKNMGFSDAYISGEKAGIEAALARVGSAIEKVKGYQ